MTRTQRIAGIMYRVSAIALIAVVLLLAGCGPREDDVRQIAREEIERRAARTFIAQGEPIGPYSPAVVSGRFVFVSGQIGIDPSTGTFAGADIASQTRQALVNMFSVLRAAGYDSSHVVQCSVFLADMNEFVPMNLVYGGFFSEEGYPARTTVEVSRLPRDASVEIACMAYK